MFPRLSFRSDVRKRTKTTVKLSSEKRKLVTITGFGIQTAASLVAKIVDIGRFESSSDLIGYFGCYPEYRDSGTDQQGKAKRRVELCGSPLALYSARPPLLEAGRGEKTHGDHANPVGFRV